MHHQNHKINILFLIGNFRLSGAFRVAWEIAFRLPKNRYDVSIASLVKLNSDIEVKNMVQAERAGIKTYALDLKNRGHILTIFDLIKILRKNKINIIHTHSDSCDTYGRIAAILAGTRIRLVTVHNMSPHLGKEKIGFMIDKILSPFTTKYIAVSDKIAKFVKQRLSVPCQKLSVIYNGVNLKEFVKIKRDINVRIKYGLHPNKWTIGCIGLIYSVKGQFNLLEAVQILKKQRNDFQVIFFGEGQDKELLEEEIKRKNISSVHVYGWCENKIDMYSSIDILVIPSFIEGLPLVMLEAFAAGIPVIATDVGAISDFIVNNDTGIIVPPGNPAALATAISQILGHKSLCYSIAMRAKAKVTELCSVENMVKKYMQIYECLYNNRIKSPNNNEIKHNGFLGESSHFKYL